MTRQEFIDEVCDWGDLIDFCRDNHADDLVEDIYDEASRDDYINEGLVDLAREYTWDELYSILDRIPTGYEYYKYDYGDWEGLGDGDFDDLKQEVDDYCLRNGIFDDEEEDEEEEPEEEPEEESVDEEGEEPIEDEDCSFSDLFSESAACVAAFAKAQKEQEEEEQRHFDEIMKDFDDFFADF